MLNFYSLCCYLIGMLEATYTDVPELSALLANIIHSIWIIILVLVMGLFIPGKRAAMLSEKHRTLGRIMGENRRNVRVLVVLILLVQTLLYAVFFHINA